MSKITPFVELENPELGLLGPLAYRSYEIEQGIVSLYRGYDEEEQKERQRQDERTAEIVNRTPGTSSSRAGTFIAQRPSRNRNNNTSGATAEEQEPLLPPPPPPPAPIYHDPDSEETPLLGDRGGLRYRGAPSNNNDDEMHDVELGEPVQQQPAPNNQRGTGTTVAGIAGAGVAAAGTYIITRPLGNEPSLPPGRIGNPTLEPPNQQPSNPIIPDNPIEPDPTPTNLPAPPAVNYPPPLLPPQPTQKPDQPAANNNNSQPTAIDQDDMDTSADLDENQGSELVIVKEVKIKGSTVPALVSGIALGSLAAYILL